MEEIGYQQVITIDDARFSEFGYDEVNFCRSKGYLIHICKYFEKQGFIRKYKVFQSAPNPTEAENDPKMESAAHYKIVWEDFSHLNLTKSQLIEKLYPFCKKVLDKIFNNVG